MDKISVIVPVYKVEAYLERCVKSLCHQTYKNLEIILVDDGSPDRSGEMCDLMAQQDDRIYVIHKKNGGLSDARNVGIECATGEYIAFIDSDDWCDPTMMEVLYNLCLQYDAQISECSYRNVYQDKIQAETACSGKIMEVTPLEAIESNLDWKYCKPIACNKLYHKNVIGDIRFPVGKIHEDEFTTHLFYLAAKKIVYIDLSMLNYERRNADSITAKFKPKNMDACEAFREKMHLICQHPEMISIRKKVCDTYCYVLLENIKKCEVSYPDCEELKKSIRDVYEDYAMLKKQGVERGYIRELDTLFEKYKGILEDKVV